MRTFLLGGFVGCIVAQGRGFSPHAAELRHVPLFWCPFCQNPGMSPRKKEDKRRARRAGEKSAEAEEEGFEPSERGLPARRFSRPLQSTTLPLLRAREH